MTTAKTFKALFSRSGKWGQTCGDAKQHYFLSGTRVWNNDLCIMQGSKEYIGRDRHGAERFDLVPICGATIRPRSPVTTINEKCKMCERILRDHGVNR